MSKLDRRTIAALDAQLPPPDAATRHDALRDLLDALVARMAAQRGLRWYGQTTLFEAIDTLDLSDPCLPGSVYTALMAGRHTKGSYYTPLALAREVAAQTLSPLLERETLAILDPAAGSGHFLLAAAEVLAGHSAQTRGLSPVEARRAAAGRLWGIDRDALAVKLARITLWLWMGDAELALEDVDVPLLTADALLAPLPADWPASFDAVIGNPPYASVFTRAREDDGSAYRERLKARYTTARGSFDLAVPFVERAVSLVNESGRCGLVLPNKILAAAYARPLRQWLGQRMRVESIVDTSQLMPFDAAVYPIVLVQERTSAGDIRLVNIPGDSWSVLLNDFWPSFEACLKDTRPLGELARIASGLTVGEAYDLREFVAEADDWPHPEGAVKLITSRLITRYCCQWGEVAARFLKARYERPLVPIDALPTRRREQAQRAKLIISGLSRRPEVIYNRQGEMQASVATVIIDETDWPLEALCALLNSAVVARLYQALYGALALSGGYVRVSARELRAIPVPDAGANDPRIQRLANLSRRAPGAQVETEIDGLVCDLYGLPVDVIDAQPDRA